jgi:hypothetical protein
MKSQVKNVKANCRVAGDYAISMEFLDETNWVPSVDCFDDDVTCQVPSKSMSECKGDFRSVHLPLSDFSGQDLSKARFAGSDLSWANFKKAKLANADFSNTDLCQTSLTNADLRGANFEGADLSFADLRFTDLRGANLSDVRFIDVDLKGARFDRTTKLPISRDDAEARGMIYCF